MFLIVVVLASVQPATACLCSSAGCTGAWISLQLSVCAEGLHIGAPTSPALCLGARHHPPKGHVWPAGYLTDSCSGCRWCWTLATRRSAPGSGSCWRTLGGRWCGHVPKTLNPKNHRRTTDSWTSSVVRYWARHWRRTAAGWLNILLLQCLHIARSFFAGHRQLTVRNQLFTWEPPLCNRQ